MQFGFGKLFIARRFNTDKFQEWNFPKYQAIMSGG